VLLQPDIECLSEKLHHLFLFLVGDLLLIDLSETHHFIRVRGKNRLLSNFSRFLAIPRLATRKRIREWKFSGRILS